MKCQNLRITLCFSYIPSFQMIYTFDNIFKIYAIYFEMHPNNKIGVIKQI